MEERIQRLMQKLDLSREEAVALLNDDKDIDRGEKKDFDLNGEQKKVAKKMKNVARAVDAYGRKREREKKVDPVKQAIIENIFIALGGLLDREPSAITTENIIIRNDERYIDFTIGTEEFTIMLTRHNKNLKEKKSKEKEN